MGLFKFRWLHRLIRRNTRPMPQDFAFTWKHRLSIAYMILGWHVLGGVMYMCYKGKSDWPTYYGLKTEEEENKKPAVYFAEILGIKKARVITMSGLSKVGEFDYEKPLEEKIVE